LQWLRSGVEIDVGEAIKDMPLQVPKAKQWYTAVLGDNSPNAMQWLFIT